VDGSGQHVQLVRDVEARPQRRVSQIGLPRVRSPEAPSRPSLDLLSGGVLPPGDVLVVFLDQFAAPEEAPVLRPFEVHEQGTLAGHEHEPSVVVLETFATAARLLDAADHLDLGALLDPGELPVVLDPRREDRDPR